jgi:hypothetical protein
MKLSAFDHSITSSARSRIDCGTASPSALAVLAFKAISNLIAIDPEPNSPVMLVAQALRRGGSIGGVPSFIELLIICRKSGVS